MSGWKLDPAVIKTVITVVEANRDELSVAVREKDMTAIEEGIGWGGPLLDPLRTAVVALVEQQGGDLMTIRNHVAAGLLGLTSTTLAYQAGNEQMAAEVQGEMLKTADSGDFTYFIKNGMTG